MSNPVSPEEGRPEISFVLRSAKARRIPTRELPAHWGHLFSDMLVWPVIQNVGTRLPLVRGPVQRAVEAHGQRYMRRLRGGYDFIPPG